MTENLNLINNMTEKKTNCGFKKESYHFEEETTKGKEETRK